MMISHQLGIVAGPAHLRSAGASTSEKPPEVKDGLGPASQAAPELMTRQSYAGLPVGDYRAAESVQEVTRLAASLPQIARTMIDQDVREVLGPTPEGMKDRFLLNEDQQPENLDEVHRFASVVLNELADKVVGMTAGAEFHGLDAERMSVDRLGDATSQHVGYVSGVLSRTSELPQKPGRELARILVRSYFDGSLKATSGEARDSKELLAAELAKAAGADQRVNDFVMADGNAYLFDRAALRTPGSLLPNLASYYAGETTLQFAAKLMNGDEKRAEAFVKHVFGRPSEDLSQMLKDPQGVEGLLVNFAATAHHQAWQWAKLGSAGVAAADGKASSLDKWNHDDIGPTRKILAEDAEAADKVGDQIESYLLREGKLVPCERGGEVGQMPLARLLKQVERNGIYNDGSDGLRILSRFATGVKERLWSEVAKASQLSDWRAGNELAGDVVAHTCASFAAQAVKADFAERDGLVTLYRDAITRFSPQLDKMLANGPPEKKDASYQAFFQELAGEFGFEALKEHMGVGKAHQLVRRAGVADLIPIACESLRLEHQSDFTAENIVKDIAELKEGLLKDDYFLGKEGYLEGLKEEAGRPPAEVDRHDLENAIRVPNAVWMWTQLTRGLVENKPQRYTGGEADLSSDQFPSNVQFNPPDIRDVELFVWARHRLSEAGHEPRKATRMALATVVLTLHKDLLQLRQAG